MFMHPQTPCCSKPWISPPHTICPRCFSLSNPWVLQCSSPSPTFLPLICSGGCGTWTLLFPSPHYSHQPCPKPYEHSLAPMGCPSGLLGSLVITTPLTPPALPLPTLLRSCMTLLPCMQLMLKPIYSVDPSPCGIAIRLASSLTTLSTLTILDPSFYARLQFNVLLTLYARLTIVTIMKTVSSPFYHLICPFLLAMTVGACGWVQQAQHASVSCPCVPSESCLERLAASEGHGPCWVLPVEAPAVECGHAVGAESCVLAPFTLGGPDVPAERAVADQEDGDQGKEGGGVGSAGACRSRGVGEGAGKKGLMR